MAVIIPPGFGEASVIHTGANGTAPFVCTLGVDLSNYEGNYVNAANNLMTAWGDVFQEPLHNTMSIERVLLAIGQDGGETPSVSSDLPPIDGERDSQNAPINCAVLVNKNTGTLGRTGRGRMFLPGMLGASQVGLSGAMDAGARAVFGGRVQDLWTALTDGSVDVEPLPPVLLHSHGDDLPSAITSFGIAPLVGTLRKRIR